MDDGQTNGIIFLTFVCLSRTPIRERARARSVVVGMDDGQTNGINFFNILLSVSNTDPRRASAGARCGCSCRDR